MSNMRHAVAKSTGATTWARNVGEGVWKVTCLNHKAVTTVHTRSEAWLTGSHPQAFCGKCKEIVRGKAPRIRKGRLGLPGRKAAATRVAA